MAGYIGATPVPQATQHRKSFTATAGQTSFATGGYTPGFIDVYLNGVKLAAADFTATNGSDVVLASGAAVGDILETISFTAFEIASQTFSGTTTVADLSVAGNATFGDNNKAIFGAGSDLQIYHDGTHSYISDVGTGPLRITTDGTGILLNKSTTESMGRFLADGAVELFYDNAKKFETVSAGIDVSGGIVCSPNTAGKDTFELSTSAVNEGRLRIKNVDTTTVQIRAGGDSYFNGGNVGIGDTSPSRALSTKSSSVTVGSFESTSASGGLISFVDPNTTNDVTVRVGSLGNNLVFQAGGSERMRLGASGNLFVGKTSISNAVGCTLYQTGQAYLVANSDVPLLVNRLGSDGTVVQFYNDSNGYGSISMSGTSTSYNTSSDYRLKTDAQPMVGASERVQALNPVNFEWIANGTRVDGFLAHEAQAVVPEAVTGTKDAMRDEEYEVTPAVYEDVVIDAVEEVLDEEGNVLTEAQPERTEQNLVTEAVMGTRSVPDYQGIDQSKLVPLLTAALQEALTEITSLKARVTALETE